MNGKRGPGIMKYIVFLLFSALLWTWIFTMISDTGADKKIVIYTDADKLNSAALETDLAEFLPEGMEMLKAHVIGYAFFDESAADAADIYILSAAGAKEFLPDASPVSAITYLIPSECIFMDSDVPYGLILSESGENRTVLQYFTYAGNEEIVLMFARDSIHTASLNGSMDNAAVEFVMKLTGNS